MSEIPRPYVWRTEYNYVGKRGLRRKDGFDKASGKGVYARDVFLPGMCWAKPLLSPYGHARIKSMDTSEAEKVPGVRYIATYDHPEWQGKTHFHYILGATENLPQEAHFYHQPVGAIVVADSERECDEALRALKIEWEELPVIIDWDEALEDNAPLLRPDVNTENNIRVNNSIDEGDVDKGFSEADRIIEFTTKTNDLKVGSIQGCCAISRWQGAKMDRWMQAQGMTGNLDTAYVPHPTYNGGSFGAVLDYYGNSSQNYLDPVLSKIVGRPVRFQYEGNQWELSEEFNGVYHFKIGFKNSGLITAFSCDTNNAVWVRADGLLYIRESMGCPNFHYGHILPYTNRGLATCWKDGAPYNWMITQATWRVAEELQMDPTDIARINDGGEHETMEHINTVYKPEHGFPDRDSLGEVLEKGKSIMDWDNKWHAAGTKILPNGKYHGMGFVWAVEWTAARTQRGPDIAISIGENGKTTLVSTRGDVGINSSSTYCAIIAEELGVKYENVGHANDRDTGFVLRAPGASSGTVLNSTTMVKASRLMKKKVLTAATNKSLGPLCCFPDLEPEELDMKEEVIFERANPDNQMTLMDFIRKSRAGANSYATSEIRGTEPFFVAATCYNGTFRGNENEGLIDYQPPVEQHAMTRQAHFMEVEIDPETGKVEVTKDLIVTDVGKILSPESVEDQQDAAPWMGGGRTLMEELVIDEQTGVYLNANHIDYHIMLMDDLKVKNERELLETGLAWGPYGATGCSEAPVATHTCLPPTAVYNAIGKWVDTPCTPEKILAALGKI